MIGDKLVITLVVVDTGTEWSAMGRIDVDTPTKKIDETAFLAATWWAIEALTPIENENGGDRPHGHAHRTTEPKASARKKLHR
jgi:hypothetical protein